MKSVGLASAAVATRVGRNDEPWEHIIVGVIITPLKGKGAFLDTLKKDTRIHARRLLQPAVGRSLSSTP